MSKLSIKNLHVAVKGKEILRGVDLEVSEGETLALLGPNGHGKSTLLAAIMGNPAYQVTEGSITFDDQDVLALTPDKRSKPAYSSRCNIRARSRVLIPPISSKRR
jgi:Fe-S cluster assembly ATP-binding protein